MNKVVLGGKPLTMEELDQVVFERWPVHLDEEALREVDLAASFIRQKAEAGEVIYGVTTGFGANSSTVIAPSEAGQLQANLLMSHASGVGDPLPTEVVRAMMCLRINALLTRHSGATRSTVSALAALLNRGIHPVVPSQGSVGSSGDLCPLAHMSLPLLGLGEVEYDGRVLSGAEGLGACGFSPIELTFKEGIALLNGTQLQTALGFVATRRLRRILDVADAACALSLEALCARPSAFDGRLHVLRRRTGQMMSAAAIRTWFEGSKLVGIDPDQMPNKKDRVQDPYSLRCAPQVHGACRDVGLHVEEVLLQEANAVTDNPVLFPDDGDILSGGNFHGEPVAMALDYLKLAIAEVGNISDRRSFKLLTPGENEGLPAFLVDKAGINSGLMIAQYVSAALVSENKGLAHPASVDSIPTSANMEDHVAMGAQAGTHALMMLRNTERVLAIELLIAAQALDMRQRELGREPGRRTGALRDHIRTFVPYLSEDRTLSGDIEALTGRLVRSRTAIPGSEL